MKLEPGERSILASFPSSTKAEAALNDLKAAGYTEVQLDRIGKFGFMPDRFEERPAISGKESSLVRAVLNPGQLDDESAILLGATTEASGLSAPDTADQMPFLVTVVTNEAQVDRAVKIIQGYGGRV
ncbi:MAG TPA: hypothetical protein VD969_08155 [Symbiobacteriaceae bacterium]|nr:hypothetical protein [Symbiobacteriaceae bacterium]